MDLEIQTQYTQKLITQGALTYWKITFGGTFLLCVAGLIIASLLFFLFDLQNWLTLAFAIVSAVGCVVFIAVFFMFKHRSLHTFKQMEFPLANWKFTDQDVSVESYLGKSRFQWSMLREIVKFEQAWLLVYQNSAYSLFPTEGIPQDTLTMIENKVRENGGKA